jgi:aspartyl-tRNA(Asn)/glutamyl-tRNA(Gln) amidotransferase subunit A
VPIAIKANYLTKDYPTTGCSHALPLEPEGMDATVVANLRAAGAIIFGKTNMHPL